MELSGCVRGESSRKVTFSDPVTGRTIHRLTSVGCNVSPYFNSYGWTADGEWFFFMSLVEGQGWVMACHVQEGEKVPLAGPFAADALPAWASLNAIPGSRAATFVQGGAVWKADLDAGGAEIVARIPDRTACVADTDVSCDGRWHTLAYMPLCEEARREWLEVGWPPDGFYARWKVRSFLCRAALDGSGVVEPLCEQQAWLSHVSVNPRDADCILFCHEGAIPFQHGRMFLWHAARQEPPRPLRDQRSGRVWVTHERWFADGRRIAYHGSWLPQRGGPKRQFVGIFDVERDLPFEYAFSDPQRGAWHSSPSPDGSCMVMDQRGGAEGLFLLHPDPRSGICQVEQLCTVASDRSVLPHDQWRELDPIWSPDGRRILFRAAAHGSVHLYVVEVE